MTWLENKYILLISSQLRNFKKKGPSLYNMSCPYCGDSHRNQRKARGYLFEKQNKYFYHCHNCNTPYHSFDHLLKTIDPSLYNEMIMEKIRENKSEHQTELENFVDKMKKPIFLKTGPLKKLKKVSQLSPNDSVKKFIEKRMIPTEYHAKLFSCPNFFNFVNSIIPDKFSEKSLLLDSKRVLIPFFDKEKTCFAFQGRALDKSEPKYITIILDSDKPKIFGMDTVKIDNTIYVFEGPFDSMFVKNSIATAGGDLVSDLKSFPKDKLVIVYDNEKRNKETVQKINKAIIQGYKVVVWPDNITQKDINDCILVGMSPEYIQYILEKNTYSGLEATLALNEWSKI